MKKKSLICILSFLLIFILIAPASVTAATTKADTNYEDKIIYISGPDDILRLTEEDILAGQNMQVLRIQRSYWKEIELISVHEFQYMKR